MNQQEIEAFAMQYHGIECVKMDLKNGNNKNGLFNPYDAIFRTIEEPYSIQYIELRSIDSLTDKECLILAKIIGHENYPTGTENNDLMAGKTIKYWFGENNGDYENFISSSKWINLTDYLRSIGIAVPFRGYSVEEMIEKGILKLKQ